MNRLTLGLVLEPLGLPLRAALTHAARLGVAGVQFDTVGDFAPGQLSVTGLREFRTLLRGHGLELLALNCPLRRGLDNAEQLDARLDHLRKVMQLAGELGAGKVVLPLPPVPTDSDADKPRGATLRDSLTALAGHGDRTGATLALEVGRDPAAATEKYLATFDTGSLAVTFDPANFLTHGHDPLAAITAFAKRIAHIHARDARRSAAGGALEVPLGQGDFDWPLALATLESVDYRGPLTLDRETGLNRAADLAAGAAYLRRFLGPDQGDSLTAELGERLSPPVVAEAARRVLADCRAGDPAALPTPGELVARVLAAADPLPYLRGVINATGVVLHTNLGRAPLSEVAAKAAYDAARRYTNLELDLATGQRSSRQVAIREGLCRLTGAEAAVAVNNCAAATLLTLRALAAGREVIVSRGQLVEIGGSYRLPEVFAISGAVLREVGTTNVTRVGDYAQAVTPQTALILRVHTSNYRVRGFTHAATLEELVALGRSRDIPVVDDAGSGAAFGLPAGLDGEPDIRQSVPTGAAVVLFSGDKLLGGPQAGVIAGRRDLVQKIERDPLSRAVRIDKMTLAALEATLAAHRHPELAAREIPAVRMVLTTQAELRTRCGAFAHALGELPGFTVAVEGDVSYVGGGSLPDRPLPTAAVALRGDGVNGLARRLRLGTPAVLARVQGGALKLDLRAVFPDQEVALRTAILQALPRDGGEVEADHREREQGDVEHDAGGEVEGDAA